MRFKKEILFSLLLATSFGKEAFCTAYLEFDLSAPINNPSGPFDFINIYNGASSNLSSSSSNYILFDGFDKVVTIENAGSIETSGTSHHVMSFTNYGNSITPASSFTLFNDIDSTLQTTGNSSSAIYITSGVSTKYNAQVNNQGLITSSGSSSSTIYLANNTGGAITINNSEGGIISKTIAENSYAAIQGVGGDLIIYNSATISAADADHDAILFSGTRATVNILDGSSIIGKINSSAGTNILNIEKAVTFAEYTSLSAQLSGLWTTNIANSGSISLAASDTITTLNATDSGIITNAGTVTNVNVSQANLRNSGSITNVTLTNGNNHITNTGHITNFTSSGSDNFMSLNSGGPSSLGLVIDPATPPDFITTGSVTNLTNNGSLTVSIIGSSSNDVVVGSLAIAPSGRGALSNITNNGTLNILASGNVLSTAVISGSGDFIKSGTGTYYVTSDQTYSGQTSVEAGNLKVNGSIASSSLTTVSSGATISGTGTTGNLTIESGGTLAAGNSIGTMNVSGDLTLNSGSITNIEYNNFSMDKVVATGNITVAGTANFSIYNYDPQKNFVVSQNVLETTGGTLTGQFDNVTIDNDKFLLSTSYTSTAARTTITKKLNSSTLDAPLMVQNSIGRMIGESVSQHLNDNRHLEENKTSSWVSSSAFNGSRGSLQNSTPFSTNGYLLSAGLVKSYEDFQITGTVFNSYATANRYNYFGKDQIETNGFALGLGKSAGDFYNSIQIGAGFYNSNNSRNVDVNGSAQNARSRSHGNFKYINVGTAYNIKVKNSGQFIISLSAALQDNQNNGFNEQGLAYGNYASSKSSAKTANLQAGVSYRDEFAHALKMPQNSFFELGLTGYQSNIYNKKAATISQGNASYQLYSQYRQGLVFGASALASLPLNNATALSVKLERRQNGSLRDNIGSLELRYKF